MTLGKSFAWLLLAALLELSPRPLLAQTLPPCVLQPNQVTFLPPAANVIAPGPNPSCLYHAHELRSAANSVNTDVDLVMTEGVGTPWTQALRLDATKAGVRFDGRGGPATLRLEYQTVDIPPTFLAGDMRAFVECSDRPARQPPLWCMPRDADPLIDRPARTVSTRVIPLPGWAAALPKLSTLTAPGDGTFTNVTPIVVSGVSRNFVLWSGTWTPNFVGYEATLRVKGATLDTTLPSLAVAADGSWTESAVALEENQNSLTGTITDPEGDASFDRVQVVLDTIPPVVTLSGIASGAFTSSPPIVVRAHELERWPYTHLLQGTRTLAAFLGVPAETVAMSYDDDVLVKTNDTLASRDFASPDLSHDGDYALSFTSTDKATNVGSARLAFTIDTVSPQASLAGVSAGSFQRLTALPNATVTDRNLLEASVTATVDGVADPGFVCSDEELDPRVHACTGRAALEGLYVVTATGGDRAGNVATPATLSFTVDRTRPAIAISGVTDGESKADPFTVSVQVTDRNRELATESARLERDGVLVSETTSSDPSFSISAEGDYTLMVSATDRAGNARLRTFTFSLDATNPVIAIDEPRDGAWLSLAEVAVVGTTDEKRLQSVTLDPGDLAASFTGNSWRLPAYPLQEGANTITATARDRAGRTASAAIVVHHDGTAPVVSLASLPALTRSPSVEVTGMASDEHLDEVRLAGRQLADLDGGAPSFVVAVAERLVEGDNTLLLEATDLAGNRASTSRRVTLDTRCDLLRILAPGSGHRTRAQSIAISGIAQDLHGISVTVAGQPATLASDGAFAVSVNLVEGTNTILVAGDDGAHNACEVDVRIERDRTQPTLVGATPASGAIGIDLLTPLVLDFSEPVVLHGGLEVKVGGSVVPGSVATTAARVVFQPSGGWPSLVTVDVSITTAVTDALGNALAAPSSWSFTTLDRTAPDRVVFVPPPPTATALSSLHLCGTAEPDSVVRIEGNSAAVEGAADGAGHFCVDVVLETNALNQLVASARDGLGNRGPGTVAYVRQETVQPLVVAAEVEPVDRVVIEFSKDMDCATITGLTVLVEDQVGRKDLVFTCSARVVEVTSREILLSADPFVLTVTTDAHDTLGNALAFRFAKVFHGGTTLVTGEVYDAASGHRLSGAKVELYSVGGVPASPPIPTATSDGAGELTLAVEEVGDTWLVAYKEGYAECFRQVVTTAGFTTPVFDFRLSRLNPVELAVPPAGGSVTAVAAAAGGPVMVTFPAGLAATTRVRVSVLAEQGLAGRLPIGWTPIYAVDLRPHDVALPGPATLRIPNRAELTIHDEVQLARFDETLGGWEVGLPPSLSSDGLALVATLERFGSFAFVVPDVEPKAPPLAVIGASLGRVLNPPVLPDLDPTIQVKPGTIFPNGQAVAEVSLRPLAPMTSGLPLQVDVRESLELIDRNWVEIPVYVADVVGYAHGALFPVKPSVTKAFALFREGVVRLEVYEFPEHVPTGNVIGTDTRWYVQGSTKLYVEAGAVDGPTPLILTERGTTAGFDVPGFTAIRAIEVSFGGARLKRGARLELKAGAGELAGLTPVALLRQAQVLEQLRWVFVSLCDVMGDVVTSRNGGDQPGVREGGVYVFADLGTTPYAPLDGTVREATEQLVDGALVDAWGYEGPVGVTYDGGQIATLAAAATSQARVVAESAATRDRAEVFLSVSEFSPATVQIRLEATGPWVTALDPGDGARNVALTRSIVLGFSEPIQLPTLHGAGAVVVTADGVAIEGTLFGVLGGLQAMFRPAHEFPANATIEVRVGASILDFAGHGCRAETFSFHAIDTVAPPSPGRFGVRVLAPDADGHICIRAPAASEVLAVTATNLETGFSAGLVRSTTTGLFEGCVWGEYGHVIRVSWLDDAGNAVSEDFDLFLEAGEPAPTVVVGPAGGSFTAADADGSYLVSIPGLAFAAPTRLTLDPKPVSELVAFETPGFDLARAFSVQMEGKVADSDLDLALDAVGLDLDPAADVVFLVRVLEVRGKLHPELVAQMEVGADGLLRTRHPAITVNTDPTQFRAKDRAAESLVEADALGDPNPAAAIAGLRRSGDHAILIGKSLLTNIAYYLARAPSGVLGIAVADLGFAAFAYEAYPELPLVLPVRAGVAFAVEYFDPKSGRGTFRRRMPPIPVGRGATDIDVPDDGAPLHVTSFAPGRLLRFQVSRITTSLAPGIHAIVVAVTDANLDGIPDDASFELELRGGMASLAPHTWVRAIDTVTGAADDGEVDLAGRFTLALDDVAVGHTILLSIANPDVERGAAITIETSASADRAKLASALALRRVGDAPTDPGLSLVVAGGPRRFTVTPTPQLEDGTAYRLSLGRVGSMTADFAAQFTTRAIDYHKQVEALPLADPNDLVKLGGILFVAAGRDGLRIVDASSPGAMTTLAIQATHGAARGVSLFEHDSDGPHPKRHAVVVGGGNQGPGFIQVIDVSTERILETTPAAPRSVRTEIASNRLGLDHEENLPGYPEGVPLRVRAMESGSLLAERDLAFVTVLGDGLQVWDLTNLVTTTAPLSHTSRIASFKAPGARDVALWPRRVGTGLGPLGEPILTDQVVAVLAEGDGIRLLDVTHPAGLTTIGLRKLPGLCRAVAVFPKIETPIASGRVTTRDLAFVAAQAAGVHVVDISDPTDPRLVVTFAVGAPVLEIAIDLARKRAIATLGAAGMVVLDISGPLRVPADATNRILARIDDRGIFNTGLLPDLALGTVYASAQNDGVVAFRFEGPRPRFVSDWDPVRHDYAEWSDIVPLGVNPPAIEHTSRARVAIGLPGGIGTKVYADLVAVDGYGQALRDPRLPGLQARLDELVLNRQSDDKLDPAFNLFVSRELVFTADPRELDAPDRTVMAGDELRARLLPRDSDARLDWLTAPELAEAEGRVRSWPLDRVPSRHPAPVVGASTGSGDALSVFLHSGEFAWNELDLRVAGRLIDFAWSRSHRSQSIGNGPLGRAWDSPYLARARVWPDGSVVHWDGNGNRVVFPRRQHAASDGRQFDTPGLRPLAVTTTPAGVVLMGPQGASAAFNAEGDLARLRDRAGNTITFLRDPRGRLETIVDTMGRMHPVSWDAEGRIVRVADPSGRDIVYGYDGDDQLVSATLGGSFTKRYTYETAGVAAHAVKSLINERGETWLVNAYHSGGKVEGQTWGTDPLAIHYNNSLQTEVTDRRGAERLYSHNAAGQLLELEEKSAPATPKTQWQYDAYGRLVAQTQPLGNKVEWAYEVASADPELDPLRRLNLSTMKRIPDAARGGEEERVEQRHDGANHLVYVKDERGDESHFYYDDAGNLHDIDGPRGATTEIGHNRHGQPIRQRQKLNDAGDLLTTTFAYWPESTPGGIAKTSPDTGLDPATGGYLRSITIDEPGRKLTTRYLYDALGRILRTVDAAGTLHDASGFDAHDQPARTVRDVTGFAYVTDYTYDLRGLPFETSHAGVTTREEFDLLGRRTTFSVEGPGLSAPLVSSWTYDENGNLETETTPAGVVITRTYNKRNRATHAVRTADTLAVAERARFDVNGNLLESGPVAPDFETTLHDYNGHDRVREIAAPLAATRHREYYPGGLFASDHLDRRPTLEDPTVVMSTTALEYDGLGFPTKITRGPNPASTVETSSDLTGNVTLTRDPRQKDWTTEYYATGEVKQTSDPLGNTVTYTYHPLGGVATEVRSDADAGSITLTTRFDALGRAIEHEDAGGHVTRATFDSRDNLETATDADGHTTRYSYDALDRVVGVAGPLGEVVTTSYDLHGNVLTYADARGNVTTYGYDGLGRKTSATLPGLTPYTWTYVAGMDLVLTETTPRGFTSTFGYDRAGHMTSREVKQGTTVVATETFAYDELGRATTLANDAATIHRTYDSAGGVLTERVTIDGLERELVRSFDAAGAVASLSYPGGRTLGVTVDDLGRFDQLTHDTSTLVDYDWLGADRLGTKTAGPVTSTFAYDPEHLPQTITRAASGLTLDSQTLQWTSRHQIDRETDGLRRASSSRFEYDPAGRLKLAAFAVPAGAPVADAARATDYGHDAVRNLTSRVVRVGGPYQRELGPTTVVAGNRYGLFDGRVRAHDVDGNLRADGSGGLFDYDYAGRLTRVSRGPDIVDYAYDVLGRKVKRSHGLETRLYWYDGWDVIEETTAGGTLQREVVNGRGIDEPLFFVADGEERHLLQDRMGSVTGVLDPAGTLLEAYEYGPYGSFRRHGPASLDQARLEASSLVLRFTGEMGESSLGSITLSPSVAGEWSFSRDGRDLLFRPAGAPDWPPGTITVTVPKSTHTAFGLELESSWSKSFDASDMSDRVLDDLRSPQVERIGQDPDGTLRVVFSEPMSAVDLASAFILRESGSSSPIPFTPTIASPRPEEVVITPGEDLTIGESYRLDLLADTAQDLSAHKAAAASWSWTRREQPSRIMDTETDSVPASLFGNRLFFQGRELDPATGLYDFRNRWYDPESGRFLTPDPLGYPDGPNQYAAFLADPANHSDPDGTVAVLPFLAFATFTGGTELAARANPDGFWGQMSFSNGAASAISGFDPRTGEPLGAFDRTIAGVGAVGHVVGLAGAGVNALTHGAVQGTRAFQVAQGFAVADRAFAGGEAALHLASGNVVGAALSGLGANRSGHAAPRWGSERGAATMDLLTGGLLSKNGDFLAHNDFTLVLEFEAGFSLRDFRRKAMALQDLAERGKLRKAPNPVGRNRDVTAQFKNRLIRRAYEMNAKIDPGRFRALRDRIRAMDPDHVQDLQLFGLDDSSNLWLLDPFTNRRLGHQVWQQIRGLADFTGITRVEVRGLR